MPTKYVKCNFFYFKRIFYDIIILIPLDGKSVIPMFPSLSSSCKTFITESCSTFDVITCGLTEESGDFIELIADRIAMLFDCIIMKVRKLAILHTLAAGRKAQMETMLVASFIQFLELLTSVPPEVKTIS
jgi:hypothetical protein